MSNTTSDSVRPLTAADFRNVHEVVDSQVRLSHQMTLMPTDILVRLVAMAEARAGSLDAAWQEALAALPEGWRLSAIMQDTRDWQARAEPVPAYKTVTAFSPSEANRGLATMWLGKGVHGDTPAAALRALAAALREAQP